MFTFHMHNFHACLAFIKVIGSGSGRSVAGLLEPAVQWWCGVLCAVMCCAVLQSTAAASSKFNTQSRQQTL